MTNEFHVLVIDDSSEVIRQLKRRISPQHVIAGVTWRVILNAVHIDTKQETGPAGFTDDTLRSLIAGCTQTPDLILADYGFANKKQSEQLNDHSLTPEQFMDSILTAPDLVPAVEEFLEREHSEDRKLAARVAAGFRDNPCRLYLYTYTPIQFKNALPTVDARAKETQQVFGHSEVIPLDTTVEFYGNERFADKHDKDFYGYLVTGLLDQIIYRELFEFVLKRETERLRFVRYYRSGAGVLAIVLLGGGIGAVGEWIGGRIMVLIEKGLETTALIVGLGAVIVFLILGLCVPLIFERLMSNLLRKLKADPLETER